MWEIQNIHWYERCRTIPSYNYENETKSLYCSIHKEDEMVYVKSKTCTHEVKGYLFIITRMRQKAYFVQYIRKLEWLTKNKKWRIVSQRGVISGSNNSNNVKGEQNSKSRTGNFRKIVHLCYNNNILITCVIRSWGIRRDSQRCLISGGKCKKGNGA